VIWTQSQAADNFVRGVQVGVERYGDIGRDTVYGEATGFVYFVAIGEPYITHVKIGFTAKNPWARVSSLQTGCPFKMWLLGFVFGCRGMEAELHDVLFQERCEGEWFKWSDYVETIIRGQLGEEAL
jgi:hypothetical protein